MDEQKRGISVARLIDREKYYKDKALKLEKSFIFANEKITTLEEQLMTFSNESQHRDKEYRKALEQLKETKTLYEDLQTKYNNEMASAGQLINELRDEIDDLKKNVRTEQDVGRDAYDQKVTSYEKLLTEVQSDINEKDKEIALYKKRMVMLEKRLKLGGGMPLAEKPELKETVLTQPTAFKALPFLDYAIVFRDKRCMIRGDLLIENVGSEPLNTPYLCFRFTPGDAAQIKGRIKSWETIEAESIKEDQWEWIFLENDWAEEAKERGEIWIYPTTAISILPGERIALSDWQIPIERKYYEHLTLEVFVYFQENDYRAKGVNQIAINF